jgi:hypothetical protein
MILGIIAAVFIFLPVAHGQQQKAEVQQRLGAQFVLTQLTPDKADVVVAGTVVALQKDGLLMCGVIGATGVMNHPATSMYKDGKISQDFALGPAVVTGRKYVRPRTDCGNAAQRVFDSGETLWVTKAYADDEKIVFRFYSDPIDNVRYWGELQVPYSGNTPDQVMNRVAEVLSVRSNSDAASNSGASDQTQPAATDAPPPKMISLGQERDEVVGTLGQPQKIVKLGAKEIDYYPDMKVTFVNGKVADVQ